MKFKSEDERKNHPQGKLINPYLMEDAFDYQLTHQEIDTLETGIHHLGAMGFERYIEDYDQYTNDEKYRIYLSLLLSNKTTAYHDQKMDLALLKDIGFKLLKLDISQIIKASALSGRLDIIKQLSDEGVYVEKIKDVLKSKEVLRSIAAIGNADKFNELLNFNVSSNLKIKDFLVNAHLRTVYHDARASGHINIMQHLEALDCFDKFKALEDINNYHAYQRACAHGQMEVIKHLEAIEGFDKNNAARANHYLAYQNACANGQMDVIKHLEAIEGFDKNNAARANHYSAYQKACAHGQMDVIKHLEAIEGFDKYIAARTIGYLAYQKACAHGQMEVIKHLEAIEGFNKHDAVSAKDYLAYRMACAHGHMDVIQHLETIERFNIFTATRIKYFTLGNSTAYGEACAYEEACAHGQMDVIKHLETMEGFNKHDAVSAKDYLAYRMACANGQMEVIKHLEAMEEFDRDNAASTEDYWAYRMACAHGHMDVIQHLETMERFDKLEAARADGYVAYRTACANGQMDVIKHLEAMEGFDKLEAALSTDVHEYSISLDKRRAYQNACANGQMEVIKHLEAIEGFNSLEAASADDYLAYQKACAHGHMEVIKHLEAIEGFDKLAAAAARGDHYVAYRAACANGHMEVIKHLEAIEGFDKLAAARGDHYVAYRTTCANGHMEVIKHLEAIEGFNTLAAARVAYRWACTKGQMEVVEHLEAIDGFDKLQAASSDDCIVYREACFGDYFGDYVEAISHLLNIEPVFAHAENHDEEYGKKYIYSFVNLKLRRLQTQKEQFTNDSANGVFDIPDRDARYYLYVLRNLIRRGVDRDYAEAENTHDTILSLLEIPSIKVLCHQKVAGDNTENSLLRFAMSVGNESAARTLLTIPAVRELAERHNFYESERLEGVDLRRLAQDRESSMTALTEGERKRLSHIEQQYGALQQEMGVEKAFSQLKLQLEEKYNTNPALIITPLGKVIRLPFTWAEFQALGLSGQDKKEALRAYYQHETHAAYRYLSRPNHWIAQNSSWVNINPDNQHERWSTFEEYKPLITLMYLASIDEKSPPTQGHTVESRFEHFIRELALIGRAHNWDDKRERMLDDQVILEEYDDLDADKPSCFSGVKRRLFQSLVGHSRFDILTHEVIEQEIQSFYREEMKSLLKEPSLTTARLELILSDYHRMAIGGDCDNEQFLLLNINKDKKDAFRADLKQKYGNALTEFILFLNDKLISSDQGDFLRFATAYDLASMIKKEIASRPDSVIKKINEIDNMDVLVDYLKSKPIIEKADNIQPRLFDLIAMPGQFKKVMDKLRPAKLTEALQLQNPELQTAHHQLLMLDKETFHAFLKKLEPNDLKTLLLAQNDDGQSFLYEALSSPDLSETLQQHILENTVLKDILLSDRKQINSLLGITDRTEIILNASIFSHSEKKTTEMKLLVKLCDAIIDNTLKLSVDEVGELKKMSKLNKLIKFLAKAKEMDVDGLYASITDNGPSAYPS